MASKSASKWAADDEDTAAALALRKKEKEEKRRLREEKARKAAEEASIAANSSDSTSEAQAEEGERPTKRQRRSPEQENGATTKREGANLLQFPTRQFNPCGRVDQFELLNNIEEGSYGFVSRARTKATGEIVALKRLKMEHTSDGFPVTGMREIQTLKACRHTNVVKLLEVVMGNSLKE